MEKEKHSGDMRVNTSSMVTKGRGKMQSKGVGYFCCHVLLRLKKINTEKRLWNPVTQWPGVLSEQAVSTE